LNQLSENISEDIFECATQSQLVSDVPVASYLSSGIDSGLISMWANKHQHVKAFTIGTDDEYTNEHDAAVSFAKSSHIDQCIYDIKENDFLKLINDYFKSHSEPFADFSSVPSLLLSKLVAPSYKVILSGDGPDELFWGYDRNIKYMQSSNKYFNSKWKLSGELAFAKLSGNKTVVNRRMVASKDYYSYYYSSLFTYGSVLIPSLFKEKCAEAFFAEEIKKAYDSHNPADCYMYIMRDMEMNINLQRILLKVDRSGMYNSVEVRVPYLSNNIIDAALHEKWTNHICGKHGKYFLKKILAARAGKDYAFKPKKGFLMPMQKWLRQSIKDDVREKILNMPSELDCVFKHKALEKLLHKHINEGKDYSGIIWAIYSLVNWHHLHRNNKNLIC
jgi:asparagine synthase (glutamine-hydrolysing)